MLSHLDWLKVPKIFWQLSTDRVLTMEFCAGGFVDDVQYMKEKNIDLVGISKKISHVRDQSFLVGSKSLYSKYPKTGLFQFLDTPKTSGFETSVFKTLELALTLLFKNIILSKK